MRHRFPVVKQRSEFMAQNSSKSFLHQQATPNKEEIVLPPCRNKNNRACILVFVAFVFITALLRNVVFTSRDNYIKMATIEGNKSSKTGSNDVTSASIIKNDTITGDPAAASSEDNKYTIRIVSMNVAMAEPSRVAPSTWDNYQQDSALRDEILRTNPDVLMLQEAPSLEWATRIFSEVKIDDGDGDERRIRGYEAVGAKRAHAGYIVLLSRQNFFTHVERVTVAASDVPVVAARMQFGTNDVNNIEFVLASCHLAPFETGSFRRQEQVEDLLKAADKMPLILAGDTNMRDSEDNYMENSLHLIDVWKLSGSSLETQYTWDTVDHTATLTKTSGENDGFSTPRRGGTAEPEEGTFNQYYGDSTRQYQRRYDRIYASRGNKRTKGQDPFFFRVNSFDLIGNNPIPPSKNHFLSDHFGIATEIEFLQDR